MKDTPTIMETMPSHFSTVMFSCNHQLDPKLTQIKLNAMRGYNTDSSPYLRASTNKPAPEMYRIKPSQRYQFVISAIRLREMFATASLKLSWPKLVKSVQKITVAIAPGFVVMLCTIDVLY